MKRSPFPVGQLTRGFWLLSAIVLLISSSQARNIVEELSARKEFSTLVTAVTEAGLVDALVAAEDVTVFAPDNRAFSRLPKGALEALLDDKDALKEVLLYHVAPGRKTLYDFENGPLETLLEGESVEIVSRRFFWWYRLVSVDESRITRSNIRASNGIIHRVNRVLDPSFENRPTILEIAAGNPDFSILAGLVEDAGFDTLLGDEENELTVFAPTNAAFEALGQETLNAVGQDLPWLRDILKNHVANQILRSTRLAEDGKVRTLLGGDLPVETDDEAPTGLAVGGVDIEAADLRASNGIVHVVEEVLLPPAPQSLVEVALQREDLTLFTTALEAAELVTTFDSTERWPAYTVFAPNNLAFESLPDGLLDTLLQDPMGQLASVLKLHVVEGRLEASHLFDGQVLHALSGERLAIHISDDGVVTVNGVPVVEPDVLAENGVLHVMGGVLQADAFTVADFVRESRYLKTLEAALEAAGLLDVLDDPSQRFTLFAPIDSAFRHLPKGLLDDLLQDPEGELTQILLYHALGGAFEAGELLDLEMVDTLQGSPVEVRTVHFSFWGWRFRLSYVNEARIVSTDLVTDNGVIHLIAGVLLPPSDDAAN